ncbi:MAG: ElyC/SanA/YdcF family protein [Weeksellaceae bacterium]|nr:ElyC/SanA/YdcF family protein [Weeksellaceae bacterium]
MKKFVKRLGKLVLGGIVFLLSLVFFANYWINSQSEGMTYNEVDSIPTNKTGLILGTSKRVRGGNENLYFKYRIDAAVQLFEADKIKFIIVSGDNSIMEYNETRDMKKSLLERGIPEEQIIDDFAGFSTLDSVLRAKEVFGQDSITLISQEFQNQRALFIAKNHDIYAVGFNAREVPGNYGKRVKIREYFARVKALMDIYVLNSMPKFYKNKEVFPNEE